LQRYLAENVSCIEVFSRNRVFIRIHYKFLAHNRVVLKYINPLKTH